MLCCGCWLRISLENTNVWVEVMRSICRGPFAYPLCLFCTPNNDDSVDIKGASETSHPWQQIICGSTFLFTHYKIIFVRIHYKTTPLFLCRYQFATKITTFSQINPPRKEGKKNWKLISYRNVSYIDLAILKAL